MAWYCPKDWKHVPETHPASDGTLMGILFSNNPWRNIRSMKFRRCNASGLRIWPWQKDRQVWYTQMEYTYLVLKGKGKVNG